MDVLHVVILAMIQGLTEFLPVSSSAHLIFIPQLFGWSDQGLAMDVAVHVGTLFALLVLFKPELIKLCKGDFRLFTLLCIATMPVLICGFLLHDIISVVLRSPIVIAISTMVFGLFLWWADKQKVTHPVFTPKKALQFGIAQAVALIPGTSRSGITLSVGRMLGFSRVEAARISFMMAIPVITIAGVYECIKQPQLTAPLSYYGLAMIISGVTGYITMRFFLKLIEKIGLLPFVIYRMILGSFLLLSMYFGS